MLSTLNYSSVTQQSVTSCQRLCCALISEENGGVECLRLWASWPTGLHKAMNHFVWAPKNPFSNL